MAQYISVYPASQHDKAELLGRVRLWNDIKPAVLPDFPGDLRDWEKRSYGKAYLNPLGKSFLQTPQFTC